MTKQNIPQLRFKGFEGEWNTPTISEVFVIGNGYTPSKSEPNYWNDGNIPWYRMEDIRENGGILTDSKQHITPLGIKGNGLFKKNSIILATTATIGIHAMIIADSLANQQFTNFSIRESLINSYSPMFVYYAFYGIDEWCKNNTNAGGLLSVNMPALLTQPFYTPSLSEQQVIARYFTHLDALIASATSQLASLKQVKTASLQAMFPQEGETTPRLRFKGFTGEWKKVKLEECLDINNDRNSNNEFGVNEVLSVSDEEGVVNQIKLLGRSYAGKSVLSYKILRTNQIVYTKSPLKAKPYGIVKVNKGDIGIVSVLYAVYDVKNDVCPDYIHFYFEPTFRVNNYLLSLINKGAKNTMNISDEMALQGYITMPESKAEQQAIADYFTQLDRQIALQTQRIEKLKQIKTACLDNMFV